MAEDITRQGVAAGKHEIEYEGDNRVVYDEVTLGTYDSAADGNGNTYNVLDTYGFSRVKAVHVEVVDGQPYIANYDMANNAILVYALDGTGEVAAATALNVDLRIEVRGNG